MSHCPPRDGTGEPTRLHRRLILKAFRCRGDHVRRFETDTAHLQARKSDRGARARGQPPDGQARLRQPEIRRLVAHPGRPDQSRPLPLRDRRRQPGAGLHGLGLRRQGQGRSLVEGRRPLSFEDSRNGDCMVINAWSANSTRVTRFLLAEMRRVGKDKVTVYFKRHYRDGTTRPARLAVNSFVQSHSSAAPNCARRRSRDLQPSRRSGVRLPRRRRTHARNTACPLPPRYQNTRAIRVNRRT